jgi:hypothetical protein
MVDHNTVLSCIFLFVLHIAFAPSFQPWIDPRRAKSLANFMVAQSTKCRQPDFDLGAQPIVTFTSFSVADVGMLLLTSPLYVFCTIETNALETIDFRKVEWWTWSGSVLHGVLIIRKLLILRIPKRPKMPSLPDRLYDFCTMNFSKPKLVFADRTFYELLPKHYSNSPNISSGSKKRSNEFSSCHLEGIILRA